MQRAIKFDKAEFYCSCGEIIEGGLEDVRISGAVLHPGEIADKYQKLINNSPFDRTNQQVSRDCPSCGLDYMTQIRIGVEEIIIYTCKCGYQDRTMRTSKN
jgi:predicted RNA-binding Zn-ribbon protein involved in translation (DUF1610 family)